MDWRAPERAGAAGYRVSLLGGRIAFSNLDFLLARECQPGQGDSMQGRTQCRLHSFRNILTTMRFRRNPEQSPDAVRRVRRKLIVSCILGFLSTDFLMFLRFFFPRVLYQPKTSFKVGHPADFHMGVDTRFKEQARIWMVRDYEGLFAIFARCTHLGCTPNWMASEQKFKCPCHGSGYDMEGINFEGPAPRPMDRCYIALLPDGEIEVDTSRLFRYPNWEGPHVILKGV